MNGQSVIMIRMPRMPTHTVSVFQEFMHPDFLPPATIALTESTSIALAQAIQRQPIEVSGIPIATSFVKIAPESSTQDAPILLLHGFDSSVFEFRRLLPRLGETRRTWAMDLLGFGFTDRVIPQAFDPEAIKAHLYAFWQTWIGEPMVLVGASMGGAAAIDFALSYPEAVKQLVLLDAAGFAKGPVLAKFFIEPLGGLATSFLRQPKVRRAVSEKAYFDPQFVTADAELCAALHLEMPDWSRALIAFTKSGGYGFLGDRIADISVPTQIMWGRQDQILGTKDATRFEKTIAHAQLTWIENCGHVPHLEKPEETARAIVSG
jgi:pimeloyl-ACP methyl ester carboxylesterase